MQFKRFINEINDNVLVTLLLESYDLSEALKIAKEIEQVLKRRRLKIPKDVKGLKSVNLSKNDKLLSIEKDNRKKEEIKIGKVIRTLYPDISDKDLKNIVMDLKSIDTDTEEENPYEFKAYKDVTKWYGGKIPKDMGCMKGKCELTEFYDNEKDIEVLILFKDGRPLGRALLWKKVKGIPSYYIDRPYPSIDEGIKALYRKYAAENGYKFWDTRPANMVYYATSADYDTLIPWMDTFTSGDGKGEFYSNGRGEIDYQFQGGINLAGYNENYDDNDDGYWNGSEDYNVDIHGEWQGGDFNYEDLNYLGDFDHQNADMICYRFEDGDCNCKNFKGKFNGDNLTCKTYIGDECEANGEVEIKDKMELRGDLEINGDLSGGKIEVNGNVKLDAYVGITSLEANGEIDIEGDLDVRSDIWSTKAIVIAGERITAGGKIKAWGDIICSWAEIIKCNSIESDSGGCHFDLVGKGDWEYASELTVNKVKVKGDLLVGIVKAKDIESDRIFADEVKVNNIECEGKGVEHGDKHSWIGSLVIGKHASFYNDLECNLVTGPGDLFVSGKFKGTVDISGSFKAGEWVEGSKWIGGRDINGDWHGEDDSPDRWNIEFNPFKALGIE